MKFTVTYTDPAWALSPEGGVDPALASIERETYGGAVDLRLGVFGPRGFELSGPELHRLVRGADAVVIYRAAVTEDLVAAMEPTVRVVARQGVGFDNLNAPLLERRGIYGFHVPDYCVDEVASHTMGLILAFERGICAQNDYIKRGRWSIPYGGVPRRMSELTAGVIGFGRIGVATTRRLRMFVRRVVAYDPYVQADFMAAHGVEKAASLAELMGASDMVLLHCVLTPETRQIISTESLAHLKPGALLVNTARGQLVDSSAVRAALASGRLAGYASDVFSPEDPQADPVNRELVKSDRVIATCHRAFFSRESEASVRRRVAQEVLHVLQTGRPPRSGHLTGQLTQESRRPA